MTAVSTRIQTTGRSLSVVVADLASPQAASRLVANFARARLGEAQEQNRRALGSVPSHRTFVDGRPEAPLETVRVPGVIVFHFDLITDIVGWIHAQLVKHAPRRSGRFASSFVILADGVEVSPDVAMQGTARSYVFANTQPYARKIERGLSGQAPNGVFQAVALLARARAGRTIKVRFTYISFHTGAGKRGEREARTPAIAVTMN